MKAKLNGLLLPLVAFGEMLQGHHRLLKARHGLSWAATIKKRTNDNQDENAPVGAGRREGVARA